jgi:hypothetical protein
LQTDSLGVYALRQPGFRLLHFLGCINVEEEEPLPEEEEPLPEEEEPLPEEEEPLPV